MSTLRDGFAIPLLVGVTSHRNLLPAEVGSLRSIVRDFLVQLQVDYPGLPLTLVSALASGGDQLAAEEALAVGARLIAPLPLPRDEYHEDFPEGPERERFDALCARATLIEVAPIDDAGIDVEPELPRSREWHYARGGMYVASHCHILLTLWDGRPSEAPGGTAQIVDYYLTGRRPAPIERRRGSWAERLIDDDSQRLAFHVVCSRDGVDGAPLPPLEPLQTFWRIGRDMQPGNTPLPSAFAAMFHSIAQFGLDAADHEAAIAEADRDISRRGVNVTPLGQRSAIERCFAAADWLALHYQRRMLLAMRSMYTLAALMGFAFVLYDGFNQEWTIFVFLSLFLLGIGLDRAASSGDWHRKYLDYRALAEGLRVQAYWRRAGLSMTDDAEFAHDNFLQKQDVNLGWIRNVMRAVALEAAGEGACAPELDRVIDEWVGEPGLSGQLHYYERRLSERTRTHRFTSRLGALSLWTGIAISVFLAIFAFRLSHDVQEWLVSAMAVLSIVAAVREAYAYRKADKELIKQYRFMRRIFANARAALDRAADDELKREILRALGEAALAEHAEWTLMHRERPLERARI